MPASDRAFPETEARFKAIFHNAAIAIVVSDREGHIVQCNGVMERMLGYEKGALIGRSIREITHPDDVAGVTRFIDELLSGDRESVRIEQRYVRRDGQPVWAHVSASLLEGEDAVITFAENISARKQAENALRDREVRLRAILDTAADGIITIDERGIVSSFNRAAEQMFCYPAREVIGRNVSVLMPSPYREEHGDYVMRYLSTGEERIIGKGREIVGRRKDGSIFPVLLAVSEVESDGQRTFTGIVRDITDLKEAEQSMRRERDFVEKLVEAAQDIVLVLDTKGRILRFNSFTEQLTGYTLAEVAGKDWLETFVPDEDRERSLGVHRDSVEGRETSGTVNGVLTRDGRLRTISWSNKRIEDEAGNPVGVLAIGHDITDLQEAQARVVQTERLAAIGEMVTGLAHESRNALQRIQACLEMLELEVADRPEAMNLVSRIQRAEDQLAQLYDDVRAYAKPFTLQRQYCELDRLWRATWADLHVARAGKRVELSEETAGADLSCAVDPYAIQQVFRNIFENSISACPDQGRIRVRAQDTDGGLRVTVADNGTGLSPDKIDSIFRPFFTTKTKGSGLGLSIVRRIVESHGGTVEARNGASGGAEVVLVFPREGA